MGEFSGIESGSKVTDEIVPTWKVILVASLPAGIQFGWALQLSLLTPYVQMLGLPHGASSFIWLCGPVSGLLVQPLAGYFSDRCKSRFGRRRPFIMSGALLVAVAVVLIGFAADIGYASGDDLTKRTKPRAVVVFVVGFWILDVANNMLQGPCRAFLADIAAGDEKKLTHAMSFFAFFMGVGNVLGYAAGSYSQLYKFLPFTRTDACGIFCANLKTCFLIHICFLMCLTCVAMSVVKEAPGNVVDDDGDKGSSLRVFIELFLALKNLSKPMWILMMVNALNWIAWFPFILYDTDWMGREVYGGKVDQPVYDMGVRAGAVGLMFQSIVLGITSIVLYFFSKGAKASKIWWLAVNILLAVSLAGGTLLVVHHARSVRTFSAIHEALPPQFSVKAGALAIFAILGIPLAVTYTIPFALAAIYCSRNTRPGGAGLGLSLGVMNLSIVIPQVIVSLSSGPIDNAFGGGNHPAFIAGSIGAVLSGVLGYLMLPAAKVEGNINTLTVGGGGH